MLKNKLIHALAFLLMLAGTLAGAESERLPSIYNVPFDVGGQFYDYQNYHGVPYLHGGLDLCAPAGSEVITPVAGKVVVSDYTIAASAKPHSFTYTRKPFKRGDVSTTRYLEVAVTTDDRTVWMFRHVDTTSIPDAVFSAAADGSIIPAGSVIGKVARWLLPVLPEKRLYDHIHLEILAADGSYLNPAQLVRTTKDYYPPVIHSFYAVKHGSDEGQNLDSGNKTLSGKVDLVFGINDRMNQATYQHSVYSASWSLDKIDSNGKAVEAVPLKEVFKFDRLPVRGDRTQLSNVIYRDSLRTGSTKVQANGNHGPRFFLINLTSGTTQTGYSAANHLDTRTLANGRYRLNLIVTDGAANSRQKSVEFNIKN